jgi:hypothetical protein
MGGTITIIVIIITGDYVPMVSAELSIACVYVNRLLHSRAK